jgi:hypothetical protein
MGAGWYSLFIMNTHQPVCSIFAAILGGLLILRQ